MSEWRPIETAPKDGTQIIAYTPSDYRENGEIDVVSWREDQYASEYAWLDDSHDDFSTSWASRPYSPTHWMPLPEPPK